MTLLQLLRFNSSAIELLGRHTVSIKLRALQRDPEYILVYLRHRDVVCVLNEFWRCWRDSHGSNGAWETVELGERDVELVDVGNLLGRAENPMKHAAVQIGSGKVVFEHEEGGPGDLVLCDKGGLLDQSYAKDIDESSFGTGDQFETVRPGRVTRIVGACSLMNLRG